jgi:hypothetical protein
MILREAVSNLIHLEWLRWAKTIIATEPNLTEVRKKRWESEGFMDYNDLSEEQKNLDRMFADKFIELSNLIVKDRFLDQSECVKRLCDDYKKHKNLFIAFDFDNTVFDFHNVGDTFPKMESLLRMLKSLGFNLILFTGNEGEKLDSIISYCKERGYEPTYINENPIMKTRKPYYNILLDDRAGLNGAYQTLLLALNFIQNA